MNQLVLIIMGFVFYGVGIVTGIYFASQIEKDIYKRTNNKCPKCNCKNK